MAWEHAFALKLKRSSLSVCHPPFNLSAIFATGFYPDTPASLPETANYPAYCHRMMDAVQAFKEYGFTLSTRAALKLTSHSALHSPQVTITVGSGEGEAQESFHVPKSLICEYEWFAKALEPDRFQEGKTNSINLAHDPPNAFTDFFYYIFHKDLQRSGLPNYLVGSDEPEESRHRYTQQLCETWVFGDKYGVPGLQNCAMFELCRTLRCTSDSPLAVWHFSLDTMGYCLQHTLPGTGLHNLVVNNVLQVTLDHSSSIDDFSALFAYDGFAQTLFKAQDEYHYYRSKESSPSFEDWPRHDMPLKYAEHFEVTMTEAEKEKIPVHSHAVWRRAGSYLRCQHCGSNNGELCCGEEMVDDISRVNRKCTCHDHDPVSICSDCQGQAGFGY